MLCFTGTCLSMVDCSYKNDIRAIPRTAGDTLLITTNEEAP